MNHGVRIEKEAWREGGGWVCNGALDLAGVMGTHVHRRHVHHTVLLYFL